MDTINERSGFLCNYEVLAILKKHRDERATQIFTLRSAKEARVAKENRNAFTKEIEDEQIERLQGTDLATVTFEAIQYLENKVQPTVQQTAGNIVTLLSGLGQERLNKAEMLQIVNLAPTRLVEMVVCVDDFETRFPKGRDMDSIINLVKLSLVEEHEVKHDPLPVYEAFDGDDDDYNNGGGAGDEEEEEELAEADIGDEEGYDDDELVQEGLAGDGEAQGRELDES